MGLHVGQAALRGTLERYARHFDALEIAAEPDRLPRPARLRRWRRRAPTGLLFSLAIAMEPETLQTVGEHEPTAALADALTARWLVVRTSPAVTPSPRHRRALAALFERLAVGGEQVERRVAWEALGLWEDDDAERFAVRSKVTLVRDLTRQPPIDSDVAYVRLRGVGAGQRLSQAAAESVGELIADYRDVVVIIEGKGAVRGATAIRQGRELAGSLADPEDEAFFDADASREDPDFGAASEEGDDDGDD